MERLQATHWGHCIMQPTQWGAGGWAHSGSFTQPTHYASQRKHPPELVWLQPSLHAVLGRVSVMIVLVTRHHGSATAAGPQVCCTRALAANCS